MEPISHEHPQAPEPEHRWTVFSNHGHVLVAVARATDLRVRDIAKLVGITERATQSILSDLDRAGFIERIHVGRRNHYRVRRGAGLRHPLMEHATVGDVLDALPSPQSDRIAPRLVV